MARRYSKYPSLGILEALERAAFGGVPRDVFYVTMSKNKRLKTPSQLSKKIYSLRQSGLVKYSDKYNLSLTPKGREFINFCRLENLKLKNKKRDGLWRLIIFDIPEASRSKRNLFRSKLNEFKCYQLQKSVYVTPYVCEKEVRETAEILGISKYVDIVIAKSIGKRENRVRKFFGL